MNQSRKPLVHLLFVGIKTPEWCNDSESGISKLLDLMKSEGSAIIALGDKEMTTADNNVAFLALKQKVGELRSEGHKADRWVVVSNNNNFGFIGHMDGRPIDFIYAHIHPGENTYLYEDDERSQYDKPHALNNVLMAMRQQNNQAEKNKLSDLPPVQLIKKLLTKMVYHLNAAPPDRNNERELREIIDVAERQLRQGKLFPKLNPVNNQQPQGTTMDKNVIATVLNQSRQLLTSAAAVRDIDAKELCLKLAWLTENASTALAGASNLAVALICDLATIFQNPHRQHPARTETLLLNISTVLSEISQPAAEAEPQEITMDKMHIVQLFQLARQLLEAKDMNALTIDPIAVCRDLTWVKHHALTTLKGIVPTIAPFAINAVLPVLQSTTHRPSPAYAAQLSGDLLRVIDAMKAPEAEAAPQPADDQKAPVVHVVPMGKRKQVVETLARAIGAIENGADLTETEKKDLVDDLAFIHRNFDTIIPERKAPVPHKNVNLILDGVSDQSWGESIMKLLDEMQKRGGHAFLFNQPNEAEAEDIPRAQGLKAYLEIVNPDSTWVVIKVNPEQKEAALGDKPSVVMMQHFKTKVLDSNVTYLEFGGGARIDHFKDAMENALKKHLLHIGDVSHDEEKAPESATLMADEILKALRNLDVTREALMTLLPKPSSERPELQEYLQGWMRDFVGMPPGPGANFQRFGRLPQSLPTGTGRPYQGGMWVGDGYIFHGDGHPDWQWHDLVGGWPAQQGRNNVEAMKRTLERNGLERYASQPRLFDAFNQFEGVLAIHAVGKHNARYLRAAHFTIQSLIPNAQVEVFAYSLDDNNGVDTCARLTKNVSKLKQHQLHVVVSAAQPMPPLLAPGVSSNLGYMLYSALSTTFRPSKGAVTMLAEGAITGITVQALQEVFVSVLFGLLESEALPQPTRRF